MVPGTCISDEPCDRNILRFYRIVYISWSRVDAIAVARSDDPRNRRRACLKDRIHFLTPASAGFEIRSKMVFLTSGKLKNVFFDDFEQYEKIDFVDFFNGSCSVFPEKNYNLGQEMDSIFNPSQRPVTPPSALQRRPEAR